jgi:very-short-patch-repair endonuclease
VVARRQLLGMGLGRRAIGGRLARGNLLEVHYGVYAVGRRALTKKGLWMAAVIAAGPGAVLSHRSAGRLWGLPVQERGSIDVTRPGGGRTRRPGIVGHAGLLAADEVARVDAIPITSAARTQFDLAGVLSMRQLERVVDEAEALRLLDRVSLPQLLERYPRHRGAANLRTLLGTRRPGGITRNDFEEAFVALIDSAGLPRPRLNADLAVAGRFFEVDCLWAEAKLVVELDGRAVHGTARAFESDRERDRILLAEGWRVTRVTWRQLRDEPEAVIRDLRRLLAV